MNRRVQREHIFKLIFSYEFDLKEEFPEKIELYFYEDESEAAIDEVRKKALDIAEKMEQIDQIINEKIKDWTTERLGKVEIAIIRLAVYEIVFDDDIPESVAINEAVELAKRYGGENTAGFINGVLANIIK